jgi:2Fe-2S ferredoxin
VDDMLMAVLPAPEAGELDMLANVAAERRPNSRLSCQIKASAALDGGTITLPETQE